MIGRASFIYVLSRLLPSGLGFVTGLVLTWLMAPAAYGLYGLGFAIVVMASSVFFDWHQLTLARFFESNHQSPLFMPTAVMIFVALCAASLLGYAIVVVTPWGRAHFWLLLVCLPGTWAYAWFEFAARVKVAQFQPLEYFWMNLARNGAILVLVVLIAWLTHNPIAVLAGAFASMFAASMLFSFKGVRLGRKFLDLALARKMLRFGWPAAITMSMAGLSGMLARPLLDSLSGHEAVGFFTVAYTLTQNSIGLVAAGIGSATYSIAVKAVDSGESRAAQAQLTSNCVLLFGLLLPVTVGVVWIMPALAKTIVGPRYIEAVTQLTPLLAASALLMSLRAQYFDHAFQLAHRTGLQAWTMVITVLLNIGLNFLLIPTYGYVGAGVASVITAGLSLLIGVFAARYCYPMPFPIRDILKIAAASALMAIILELQRANSGTISIIIQVASGSLGFLAALVALNLLDLRKRFPNYFRAICARHR
jgi:O-antigen/teichoic acid export membrane protein